MRALEFINSPEQEVDEGPASRDLCTSGKPNAALGASNLASCKAQGYRTLFPYTTLFHLLLDRKSVV